MITGKGMFSWIIERCGEPVDLAHRAKEGGCKHVLVKLADGVYPYYGRNYASHSTRDYTMELVGALRDEDVEPIAWQYVYGNNPVLEAQTIVARLRLAGLDKLIVNAEVEYKAPGMGSRAVQYCQKLKSEMPGIRLGLSSFRFPTYHREFPWGEFGQFMECYMPQVYWQGAHNPVEQLGRCLREYANLPYPNKPIYPTGAAYKVGEWRVLPGEDTAFMRAAKDLYRLGAVNFWEWYQATVYLPYCWNEISTFDWGDAVMSRLDILWREAGKAGWDLNP